MIHAHVDKILSKMQKCANIANKCQFGTMSHCQTNIHLMNMSLEPAIKSDRFIYHAISLHPVFLPSTPTQNNMQKFQNDRHTYNYAYQYNTQCNVYHTTKRVRQKLSMALYKVK